MSRQKGICVNQPTTNDDDEAHLQPCCLSLFTRSKDSSTLTDCFLRHLFAKTLLFQQTRAEFQTAGEVFDLSRSTQAPPNLALLAVVALWSARGFDRNGFQTPNAG